LSVRANRGLLSVKIKTIALVLVSYFVLSVVFFFIRYTDIKKFVHMREVANLKLVESSYKLAVQRVQKFYVTRGYANIHSFGVETALEKRDAASLLRLSEPRWKIMKKENPYWRASNLSTQKR
jgi:two-component system, NtrC family, C4-dicarboxylate transport sensor histidine kinase DctB